MCKLGEGMQWCSTIRCLKIFFLQTFAKFSYIYFLQLKFMLYRIATTIVFHVVSFMSFTSRYSQKIATFEMNMSADDAAFDTPVHFWPHAVRSLQHLLISLQEVNGWKRKMLPNQLQVSLARLCKVPRYYNKNK